DPAEARAFARQLECWNMHGATEVCGTICMTRVDPDGEGPIPSGRPFPRAGVHLLDEDGAEVAPGAVGEIHVTGPGVAGCYLGQPELSAAQFVPTRWGLAYRTRDLGRWRPDGQLETLGRIDDVVKLSGQRVALGEIEQTLARHPGVRRAAVLVEGQRLVAFVETEPGMAAPASWREVLTRTLPAAMIPARVTALAGLPLTGAGKVDRRALTALAEAAPTASSAPPATPLEHRIATLWEAVLEVAPIGRDDDFFALGGSSLRSIQVAARLRAEGIAVEARTLLLARTVAALAARIEEATEAAPPAAADTITLAEQEFWASWRLDRPQAGAVVRRVLAVTGAVPPPERWAAAWADLIARHPALRGGFDAESDGTVRPLRLAPTAVSAPFPVEEVADPAAARARIEAHLAVRFDPTRPPLARAGLVRITAADGTGGETLLWLGIHHAVADGESVRQLESDLLALVEGRALPPAADGPALARAEEARHRDGPAAEAARQAWRDRLDALAADAAEPLLPLPAETRPAPALAVGPLLTATLTAREAAALDLAARRARAGRHAVLLALLGHEAQRRDGRPRLLIGCGVSLRPAAAETAVGLFVHLVPVALTAAPEASLAERIAAAQAGLDAALATAWLPPALIQADFRRRHPGLRPPELPPLLDLALTAAPSRFHQGDGLTLRPRALPGETALPAAGLTLAFSHEPREDGGIDLALAWRPDRIDAATAQGWLDGFAAWARRLAAAPNGLDAPLPPLRPEEEALLAEWERGPTPPARPEALHRRFAAAAAAAPERIALVSPSRLFTRAEINRHADRVAALLRHHVLPPGAVVAVLADTVPALPGAVLGVWKAGGVYLPLPPDLPPARRAAILADAGARLLLVLPGQAAPAGLDPALIALACPDPGDAADGAEPAAPPPAGAGEATGAAYLIYTSGTTGTPKGVALRHDALALVGSETARVAGLNADDRVALAASPGFDASLWEIALALAAGAAWVPVPRGWRDDPWTLRRRYAELGITAAYLSPSYLRLAAEQSFSGLRVLLTGGEAPTHQDFDRLADSVPTLCNAHGPTEATVLVSIER
ncbi:MAG: hypothetical protein RLZZ501_1542, partial [Pseudomonadota bacterium]